MEGEEGSGPLRVNKLRARGRGGGEGTLRVYKLRGRGSGGGRAADPSTLIG